MLIVSFLLGFFASNLLMFGVLLWLVSKDTKLTKSEKEYLRDYLEKCYGDQ